MKNWLDLHLTDDEARKMNRKDYYEARSWLRQVRRNIVKRYEVAYIDPMNPQCVIIPEVPMEAP